MTRFMRLMVAVALLAPVSVMAQESGAKKKRAKKESLHDQFTGQGYGVAGCGLGSVVFGPKPGMVQIVAATLNHVVSANQIFGISSGTLNCDIPEMGQQAAAFIEVNREILAKEAARGNGETVAGLSYILKCSNPATFGRSLQQNYERIFNTEKNSYDATREILSTIKNDQELQASCHTLG